MRFVYSLDHINFSKHNTKHKMFDLLREHDGNSFEFSVHTGKLNVAIAKELDIKNEGLLYVHFLCGVFHDIGKLGMQKEFINYEGSYTIQMYNEMKKHAGGGGLILEKINAPKEMIDTAKYHHCNFDGSGYPGGFYGKEIPFHARVTRVSDSVDAYMSKRCYKEGGPAKEALDDLEQYTGTSYDPEIVDAFSYVHMKVMKRCHKEGFDHPSKNIYMHFLNEIYGEGFEEKFREER